MKACEFRAALIEQGLSVYAKYILTVPSQHESV